MSRGGGGVNGEFANTRTQSEREREGRHQKEREIDQLLFYLHEEK